MSGLHFWEKIGPRKWKSDLVNLKYSHPLQGGYRDFVPRPDVDQNLPQGPSRASLREDLCYYLANHSDLSPDSYSKPLGVSWFLRKIVASHYMQVIRYNAGILRSLEWPLLRQDALSIEMSKAEGKWSDLQTIASCCNNYVEDLEEAMLSLGIDSQPPETGSPKSWVQDDADFRYLLGQAKSLTKRVTELNSAFTGLTSIIGNDQANAEAERSIQEAQSVRVLTLLATVFIPLSFTCGLLSMSDEYLPGSAKFWVFFAVSVPLVILIFVIAALINLAWLRPQQLKALILGRLGGGLGALCFPPSPPDRASVESGEESECDRYDVDHDEKHGRRSVKHLRARPHWHPSHQ